MQPARQRGSALLFILIGVAMFAALGYALTRSGGGGVASGQAGQARLRASEILQTARALQTAIQEMKINGVAEEAISFENNFIGGYVNAQCSGEACRVFLANGGGLNYIKPEESMLDRSHSSDAQFGGWIFSGANAVPGVGTDGGDAANTELLAVLPWVQKSLCLQINTILNINNPGGNPPILMGAADLITKFTGAYVANGQLNTAALHSLRTGCFQGGGTPPVASYHFYQVLLAR